jgi:putative heme iron utilization protein
MRRVLTSWLAMLVISLLPRPGSCFVTSRTQRVTSRWVTASTAVEEPAVAVQRTSAAPKVVEIVGEGDTCEYLLNIVEKARTVASSCSTATFCTSCAGAEMGNGFPFGSHVDYVLDGKGWPVMLLNDQSMHTVNVNANPKASLFAQMPSTAGVGQPSAAMARVTVCGEIVPVEDQDELYALRATYSVTHGFAAMLVESDKFKFMKMKPEKIYYVGGFGVNSQWVDVDEYEMSEADPLALESLALVNKLTSSNQEDLRLLCSQFVGVPNADSIAVATIDRLGMDIRVSHTEGEQQRTEVFRVGFQVNVRNLEEAKSEILKIFQESWEKSEGEEWEDMGPPVFRTSTDILG